MEVTANVIPDSIPEFAEFHEIPFAFESNSGYLNFMRWFRRDWASSLNYVVIYLVLIVLLRGWMRNREKFELKKTIALWNFGLALFSIVGTVRTLPELVRLLGLQSGFHRSACDAT